jgi:hypothetical protein
MMQNRMGFVERQKKSVVPENRSWNETKFQIKIEVCQFQFV